MERHQNAGLARNYAADVIVVGTSVVQNFLPSHIWKSWGRHATKLSMAGSTAHEQFLVADAALSAGRVKTVLWALDEPAFGRPANAVRDDQAPFPFHMYRKVGPNIEYLLSFSSLRLSILAIRGAGIANLDQYEVWYDQHEFGEKAVLKGRGPARRSARNTSRWPRPHPLHCWSNCIVRSTKMSFALFAPIPT